MPIVSDSGSDNSRRKSILDYNGVNSINNFVSSFQRAQSFTGRSFQEDEDLSPLASPLAYDESAIIDETPELERGSNNIHNYRFANEHTNLLRQDRRRTSISSTLSHINGNSTVPQTIFNSVNTLIGIALVSLPYGFKLSGWFFGTVILTFCYLVTFYSAKILGDILRKKPHLITYGDIGGYCGGNVFQFIITMTFIIDITGAMVSLSILFSDSFSILFPDIHYNAFKVFCYGVMFILTFLPLSILSMFSLVGIISVFATAICIIVCGFLTTQSPGSLLNPVATNFWPQNNSLMNVFLALGIFMAPWGGHPVYPELYRDMRHPQKFTKSATISFSLTFFIDYSISIIGFLMYGSSCEDSLIKNLMHNKNYPGSVKTSLMVFMGILPLCKMPLLARPIITVYENYFQLNDKSIVIIKNGQRTSDQFTFKIITSRVLFVGTSLVIALCFRSFGKVIAFVGSLICYNLCMTFPLYFKLVVFQNEISQRAKVMLKSGILVGMLLAIAGTIGAFYGDTS